MLVTVRRIPGMERHWAVSIEVDGESIFSVMLPNFESAYEYVLDRFGIEINERRLDFEATIDNGHNADIVNRAWHANPVRCYE